MQTVDMAITYTHLDADTHITEPPDVWTARVPARYRDHVPQMVRDAGGNDVWVLEGKQISQVKFLVDGKEASTLAGHADLSNIYETSQVASFARQLSAP